MKHLKFICSLSIFFFAHILIGIGLSAQCNSTIMLTTQNQVDSFNILYGCSDIDGNLHIVGSSILSLDSLYRVNNISDRLIIQNCDSLGSLSGLQNLEVAMYGLEIENADHLKNLEGLENLKSTEEIIIIDNDSLEDISHLDSFFFVYNYIQIENNPLLNECGVYWLCNMIVCDVSYTVGMNGPDCYSDGFALLGCGCSIGISVPQDVTLRRQVDVDKMQEKYNACPFILDNLAIKGSTITNLDSLAFLQYIGSSLLLDDTDSLINLSGLQNLNYVEDFIIQNNSLLQDVSAIDSNVQVIDYLSINNNPALETCRIPWICKVVDKALGYEISSNKGDCAEESDVVPYCPCVTQMNYKDLILTSQAQIDSVPIYLSQCPATVRNLHISGSNIVNLDSLTSISQVSGELIITDADRLKDLQGLKNLVLVGKNFAIIENDSLLSFSGLENLLAIQNEFTIESNSMLNSVSQMDSALNIRNQLGIRYNSQLNFCNEYWICKHIAKARNASIFNNGPSCSNYNEIEANCVCVSNGIRTSYIISTQAEIDSLPRLMKQCGLELISLRINGQGIKNLDSLYVVDTILNELTIIDCDSLESLDGLSNLKFVSYRIRIAGNDMLQDIEGINPSVFASSVEIVNNTALNTCTAQWLCNTMGNDEFSNVEIEGNASECQSEEDVTLQCACDGVVDFINVSLISQSALDSFVRAYQLCDFKVKNLQLEFRGVEPIVNLDSLVYLDTILSTLSIYTSSFTDTLPVLDGLSNLVFIGGNLNLTRFDEPDLSSFSEINYVGGDIEIFLSQDFTSLEGLDSTIFIGGDVRLVSNQDLQSCSVPWVCHYLFTRTGEVYFDDNGSGCSSSFDLIEDCGCSSPVQSLLDVFLPTQAMVDSFAGIYKTCPFKINDFEIEMEQDHPLFDPYLYLKDPVYSLDSLYVVDSIFDDFEIKETKWLTNLNGLQNLKFVGDDLEVEENHNITSIAALSGVTYAHEDIDIEDNSKLLSLVGLQNISNIPESVGILRNNSLKNLDGLEGMTAIQEDLDIRGNSMLTDLTALSNIVSVGELLIRENLILENLDGLENLQTVSADFTQIEIEHNPRLSNISALSNISNFTGRLYLISNPNMTPCNLGWICDHIAAEREYQICLNDTGCLNPIEILAACNCPENLILPDADGLYRAKNMISTSGNQTMMQYGVYDAPNVELKSGFEVPKGTSLWVLSKGCE